MVDLPIFVIISLIITVVQFVNESCTSEALSNGVQQILLNFVFMHKTAVHKFQFFVFMGIAKSKNHSLGIYPKLHAKMTCIHANILKKILT